MVIGPAGQLAECYYYYYFLLRHIQAHTSTQNTQTQTAKIHLKYKIVNTNRKAPSCAH